MFSACSALRGRCCLTCGRVARGRILNISSIGGYRGGAGFGIYCSTKFAVEGLSEALHAELEPLGIHVTVVEPGYFRTDFLDSSSLTVSAHAIEDYTAPRAPPERAPSTIFGAG